MYNNTITNNRINNQDIKNKYIESKILLIIDFIKYLSNIII